jgi:hypothetical protein
MIVSEEYLEASDSNFRHSQRSGIWQLADEGTGKLDRVGLLEGKRQGMTQAGVGRHPSLCHKKLELADQGFVQHPCQPGICARRLSKHGEKPRRPRPVGVWKQSQGEVWASCYDLRYESLAEQIRPQRPKITLRWIKVVQPVQRWGQVRLSEIRQRL